MERRAFLLSSLMLAFANGSAMASPINRGQTFVLEPGQIRFAPWNDLPPGSGEMASLYGGLNEPGPYLVLMKWNPGWFSAPHSYVTDRVCMVLSGTWWVNSGSDFDPANAVAVGAGGFVKRAARTFHYDGVPAGAKESVVIAIFGIAPVDIELAEPGLPSWRRV